MSEIKKNIAAPASVEESQNREHGLSGLIRNPSGISALSAYIDLERMNRDPHYYWLVYYGMMNPTWDGVLLPEGKTISWRQLAECMRKDHFRAAPEVEKIADMTEMAGERCPLMRLPLPEPGCVMTIKNPKYRKDSIYQKLEDHILSDYGLIMLDVLKSSALEGRFERCGILPGAGGAQVRKASFDNFYFHRTDYPDITQGDVIIHADLVYETEGQTKELQNVRLRIDCGSAYTLGEINWLLKENKQAPLTKLIVPIDMKGKRRTGM